MDSLVLTILIIIVCLVLFGLVYVSVQYQELERRFNLIVQSQKELSSSQVSLAEGFGIIAKDFEEVNKLYEKISEQQEYLAKVQQQQTINTLKIQLLKLVDENQEKFHQLMELEKIAHPGKSEIWYLKKIIFELQSAKQLTKFEEV